MRAHLRIVCIGCLLVTAVPANAVTAQDTGTGDRHVQRSIDGALQMLDQRDVSHLSAAQRAKRSWIAAELRRYQAAGEFPQNRHFRGDNVPYFVDQTSGAICAVGHLMAASGRRDLVERIASDDNNVWVLELAADPEVGAWLDEHGLTLAEAARIQVPYMGGDPGAPIASRPDVRGNADLVAIGVGVATAGLLTNVLVRPGHESRTRATLGAAAGLFGVVVGFGTMQDQGSRTAGLTIGTVGVMSLVAAGNTVSRVRRNERIRFAPIIPVGREDGAGVSFSFSF